MTIESTRACIDRVIPPHLELEARRVAVAQNPANALPPLDHDRKAAADARKLWQPGQTLRIRFLDGTRTLQEQVKRVALQWTEHANLELAFGDDPDAEIRVAFAFDPGSSWSAVGTDALVEPYFPRHQPTMSLGWLTEDTPDKEVTRVVLHEFGHAIGCIHEHQNPKDNPIRWKEEAVYAYFAGRPNYWSRETTRYNVIDRYATDIVRADSFDPDSIMLYEYPPELTVGGLGTRSNSALSASDIRFIKELYPR